MAEDEKDGKTARVTAPKRPSELKPGEYFVIRPVQEPGGDKLMQFFNEGNGPEAWICVDGDQTGQGVNLFGTPTTLDDILDQQLKNGAEICEARRLT